MVETLKFKPLKANVTFSGDTRDVLCPVCKYVLKDDEDARSVMEDGACWECVTTFKYTYITKWLDGWRPSKDEARAKMHI